MAGQTVATTTGRIFPRDFDFESIREKYKKKSQLCDSYTSKGFNRKRVSTFVARAVKVISLNFGRLLPDSIERMSLLHLKLINVENNWSHYFACFFSIHHELQ